MERGTAAFRRMNPSPFSTNWSPPSIINPFSMKRFSISPWSGILEDIIDSGRSMKHLLEYLHAKNPKQVIVATLFHKPKAAVCQVPIAYKGIELENDFVVGRGLDYDGLGRNYPDLYILNA